MLSLCANGTSMKFSLIFFEWQSENKNSVEVKITCLICQEAGERLSTFGEN